MVPCAGRTRRRVRSTPRGGDIAQRRLPRARPRFELETTAGVDELAQAFSHALRKRPDVRGRVFSSDRVELFVPKDEAHAWSPQVTLIFSAVPPTGTFIRGIVGPSPQVWTLYATLYGLSALGVVAATVFGLTQWFLGGQPLALLGIPASMLLSGLVYGASFVGQGLGSEQTYRLRRFVEEVVRELEALR